MIIREILEKSLVTIVTINTITSSHDVLSLVEGLHFLFDFLFQKGQACIQFLEKQQGSVTGLGLNLRIYCVSLVFVFLPIPHHKHHHYLGP